MRDTTDEYGTTYLVGMFDSLIFGVVIVVKYANDLGAAVAERGCVGFAGQDVDHTSWLYEVLGIQDGGQWLWIRWWKMWELRMWERARALGAVLTPTYSETMEGPGIVGMKRPNVLPSIGPGS